MNLGANELRQIYEAIILPYGHPDPVGYVTRAILLSGGDPDFFGADGRMGFMPITPEQVAAVTGQTMQVASLQENIMATLLVDTVYFKQYASVRDMTVATNFGEEFIENETSQISEFLSSVNKNRPDVLKVLNPPKATVNDVINLLRKAMQSKGASKNVMSLVNELLV